MMNRLAIPQTHSTTEKSARALSVLLTYPNTRDVALSNLGFQQVYSLLNQIEGVECDRYALPDDWTPETGALSPKALRSEEQGKGASDFDLIAFSISFEPDYLHAVTTLEYFGIPLEANRRDESFPLIVAGGSAIFINPEPLADVCDAFFIGEAEGLAEKFFQLLSDSEELGREEFLRAAAKIPGIYVPRFYQPEYSEEKQTALRPEENIPERVRRQVVEGPTDLCTHSVIHDGGSTFKNMALMEATRGCLWACRFCTAGFIYRPPREPDLEKTYASLSRQLEKSSAEIDTIGLVGPSVTDHPDLLSLARKIVADGKAISFSSLRMETLTGELVDLAIQSGQKTLTIAVDAPSERMRNVINKAATDEFVIQKCRDLTDRGILHLKVYSIIGLPEETDDDIAQFIRLVEAVHKTYVEGCSQRGNIGNLTIGLSPLVPKPGTPFQWHPMERVKVLKSRFKIIRKALGRLPYLKLSFGSPHEAYLQTYLSRGDRRMLEFFKTYLKNGRDAKAAMKQSDPHPDQLVYRQYQKNDFLPWDVVDHGYFNNFLWQDYQRGLREAHTPLCDVRTCKICGIC